MREVTADADETRTTHRSSRIFGSLLVVGTTAFVAVIILSTGQPSPAWMLYMVPIIIGALVGDVPGGVVATAMAAGSLALVAPEGALADSWPELGTGFAVLVLSAVVVGAQAGRQRRHAEALERVSTRDPLTGLLKSESFVARVAEETRRAERYGTDVGLVAVRVEEIESFTRTFGRYKADLMLEHLAEIVRLSVRDTDIVGRIGPVAFGVLLPYAHAADSAGTATRIETAVHDAEFEGDALEPVTHCHVKTAYGSYPSEADSARALMSLVAGQLDEPTSNGSGPVTEREDQEGAP